MARSLTPYLEALAGIAVIAWVTSAALPALGLASSALLFLLPVLLAARRGGVGPALFAALGGAAAYNFFLLEPRLTFRIHQVGDLVSVFVLVAVAQVTSNLASRLMAREGEAKERARLSAEAAELSALLAGLPAQSALARGVAMLEERYGTLRLLTGPTLPQDDPAFSSLDLAAAAWAVHNGDATGHGTQIMPAADWTFLPLVPKNRHDAGVAALARPADGTTRTQVDREQMRALCQFIGQFLDRDALEAARREREVLEQGEHLRRTFLASLAHDFRTPLTVIAGQLAKLAPTSPDARDALAAAHRLDRMMTDLLGAARIEDGSLSPILESVDLVDAVGSACDGRPAPDHIALERLIPADLPFISADPVLLHHVLINLLDNAFHHATSNVTLSAVRDQGRILLQVSDDGPGVPVEERERVFERFARIEGGDRSQGSGLGLAIVKGFADAMGMAVSIDNGPSGGARFTLALPVVAASAAAPGL